MNALAITTAGLTGTLTGIARQQMFLKDVIVLKQDRGDKDVESFKAICKEFDAGQYATVSGAAYSMRQWIKRRHPSPSYHAMREAFLSDLEAVIDGSFFHAKAA